MLLQSNGQGAALTDMGTLDSQTAFLRAEVILQPGDGFVYDETQRGIELCSQARRMKVDEYVRMDAGFEALVCNRNEAGLQQVFITNVTIPGKGRSREDDPSLPRDPNRNPPYGMGSIFASQNGFEWARSGTWHYGGYGASSPNPKESRFLPDLCGFVSFYDPRLTSLQDIHHGGLRPGESFEMGWGLRRGHRLLEISVGDAQTVVSWVKKALKSSRGRDFLSKESKASSTKCSGMNWQAITEVITAQHKSRIREILNSLARKNNLSDQEIVERVHLLSHAVLHPFLEYPADVGASFDDSKKKAIHECSTLHTGHLTEDSYNEFEALILDSVEIVLTKLCSLEWKLFQWSEGRTTDRLRDRVAANDRGLISEIDSYHNQVYEIYRWMGWDLWDRCDRICDWDELCYIPMWPVVYSRNKHQGGPWGGSTYTKEEEREFWRPKCVSFNEYDRWGGRARDPEHQLPDVPWINEPPRIL